MLEDDIISQAAGDTLKCPSAMHAPKVASAGRRQSTAFLCAYPAAA